VATDSSHARIRELNHSAAGGLAISQVPGLSPSLAIAAFSIAAMGIMPYYPCFWPIPTKLLSPSVAAAASDERGNWRMPINAYEHHTTSMIDPGVS
jgi:hypothetical protein